MLIAATAIAREATVVTANTREFARIDDLRWEDWEAVGN
jgi:predicted nucleic acid-binding protein